VESTDLKDAELVGGVLFGMEDVPDAARALSNLLTSDERLGPGIQTGGFDPELVRVLRQRFDGDQERISRACLLGGAWILGRRSVPLDEPWEIVASLPSGLSLPPGLRRTTAETLVELVTGATQRLRIAAPFIDWAAMSFLADALSAATGRGVRLLVFLPTRSTHAAEALKELREAILDSGDVRNFSVANLRADAPWAHLKVVSADSRAAYIGSANMTGAGIAGPNLELGVYVRGASVGVVEGLIDSFRET
jgi:phosphatidylserine/phosphatidylglycerophosphate/cardiolipin synthase-like enzyme